jgi:cell division protease FtsH
MSDEQERTAMELQSRPKESERDTRKPLPWWDRVKFLILFGGAWLILAIGEYSRLEPKLGRYGALYQASRSNLWLLVLFGMEAIRQLHYLIAGRSKRYYTFSNRVFRRGDRAREAMDPWTRYRLGRVVWVISILLVIGAVISWYFGLGSPLHGVVVAPLLLISKLPAILQVVFIISLGILQFVAIFWFMSKGGIQTYMPDDLDTRFTDVKGQDAVLHRVSENIVFLEDPESIESRGGYVPGGILLWGPPGTGKTLMAQAVAGETAKPFVFIEPGAFINMFFGVGILKVKALYRKLRKLATRYGGVIAFFDEADSLGNRGAVASPGGWQLDPVPGSSWATGTACNGLGYISAAGRRDVFFGPGSSSGTGLIPQKEHVFMPGMGMGGGGMGTLQSLLSEMDGLKKPRGFMNRVIRRALGMKPKPPPKYRILHIFATNQPGVLDEAMLRPGRIDRIYKVGYPHVEGRKATFDYYLDQVRHELTEDEVTKLATITPYASGAMIKDMVNEALVIAIRDSRDTITWQDIIRAKQLKEHGLPDDHEYIERERHAVAVHEACHAVVAYRLRKHAVIDVATIERRGDVGGFVSSIPPEDQFVNWRSERDVDVMTFLASLAGERLFFDGDHSTGVAGDMRGATSITTQMLAYYAMGDTIAARSVNLASMRGAQPLETGADRGLFDTDFGKQVENQLGRLYDDTWRILEANRWEVLAVAHALEVHRTITGDDVAAIVEARRGSLLDGRSYQDPMFRQELLAYHDSAVQAHRDHSGVGDGLPMPVPPAPEGALVPTGNGHGKPGAQEPTSHGTASASEPLGSEHDEP